MVWLATETWWFAHVLTYLSRLASQSWGGNGTKRGHAVFQACEEK